MLPADERLDADDGTALEIDHRLVVDDELVLARGAAQLGDQLEASHEILGHSRRVQHVLRLA